MAEDFDAEELAAADALDREIDRVLAGIAGRDVDPTVTWLTSSIRSDPPPRLGARVRREEERLEHRRWRPAQIAAAALAALFLTQGLGNLFNGSWVARNLGEHYSPHTFNEAGLALLAIGAVVAAGVLHRRWLPVSVGAGAPLGMAYGVFGAGEVGQFTAGAVLHLGQAAVAAALLVVWWRARRYAARALGEGGA